LRRDWLFATPHTKLHVKKGYLQQIGLFAKLANNTIPSK
jgi:hypothetical protein